MEGRNIHAQQGLLLRGVGGGRIIHVQQGLLLRGVGGGEDYSCTTGIAITCGRWRVGLFMHNTDCYYMG